jgi:cytochrome P450
MLDHVPPGPRGDFIIGHLRKFLSDPLGFVASSAHEYGDVVRLRFLTTPVYLISDPQIIEDVLVTRYRKFPKGFGYAWLRRLLGDGLITSAGATWLHQRKLVQPAFHRDRMASYFEVLVGYVARMLAGWTDGDVREIHEEMIRVNHDIISEILFGSGVGGEAQQVKRAFETVMALALPITTFPTPAYLRWRLTHKRLDEVVERLVRARRARGEDAGDILSMLLDARDEAGSRMTEEEVRVEIKTLLFTGYDTTAVTLSWALHLVSTHPQVEAALQAELDAVLRDRPDGLPTLADLPRLSYTMQIVKETLRLFPTAWIVGRQALEDCMLGGYPVAKGSQVFISQWVVHRDPRLFAGPEAFRPERWEGDFEQQLPRCAYFPFAAGPRHCIGHALAMMQAVLVLAAVAHRFRLRQVPGVRVIACPQVTLWPKGIRMVLSSRHREGDVEQRDRANLSRVG